MYVVQLILSCLLFSQTKALLDDGILETGKNPFVYLEEQNYPYENHTVTTEDGYNLLLVRIPYNRNQSSTPNKTGPPILFVHGLLASFYDFLITGPGIAFGFKALEIGYDIFLLNVRGTRWSRSHVTLDPDLDANQFWNFSWHEIGVYDLPASIDYITNLTGYANISYVGHSQGTTVLFALGSSRPEYNERIRIAALLAPVAYLSNAQTPLVAIPKDHVDFLEELSYTLQINELLGYNVLISQTGRLFCSPNSVFLELCAQIILTITGPSTETNKTLISAYVTNAPAGSSTKQWIHYLQNAKTDTFRHYDYGEDGNIVKYGQSTPPDYDLTAVTLPTALYYGASDYYVAIQDVLKLTRKLPNIVTNVLLTSGLVNHLDVVIGTNAESLVTDPALNIINKYNNL